VNEAAKNLEVFLSFMERWKGVKLNTKREIFKLLEKYKSIVFVAEEKKCIVTTCSIFSRQFGGASVNKGIEVGWRVFA